MLREELYRACWNWSFMLALALGTLSSGYGLSEYCFPKNIPGTHPFNCNAYDAVIFAQKGPNGVIALLVPLLAVLPFADSYALDRTQGYLRHVLVRSSYRRYFFAKFVANLLAGGLAVALPLLLLFGYTNLVYPRGLLPIEESRVTIGGYPYGPLGSLYRIAPDLYILFRVGVGFIFGATYATLGLDISSFVNNRYIVLATPFLLYHVANFVLAVLGLERWSPPVTFIPDAVKTTSWLTVFGELGGIFVVSVLCLLVLARKDRVYA